jgi:hypothetical protein
MKFATLKAQVVTLRAALEAVEASIAIEEAKRAAKKSGAPTLPASPEPSVEGGPHRVPGVGGSGAKDRDRVCG